jgi:hypothetical protein
MVEEIAARILWGLDEVPTARAVVRRVLGADVVIETVPRLPRGDAAAHEEGAGWALKHLARLRGPRLRWALVHEAVEVELRRLGFTGDVELLAEAVTGAIVMPRAAFIREAWRCRMDHAELARLFLTSQTAVVLRFTEAALVQGSAVVHPRFVFSRGVLPKDERGVVKKPVTDAPRRTALLAS